MKVATTGIIYSNAIINATTIEIVYDNDKGCNYRKKEKRVQQ